MSDPHSPSRRPNPDDDPEWTGAEAADVVEEGQGGGQEGGGGGVEEGGGGEATEDEEETKTQEEQQQRQEKYMKEGNHFDDDDDDDDEKLWKKPVPLPTPGQRAASASSSSSPSVPIKPSTAQSNSPRSDAAPNSRPECLTLTWRAQEDFDWMRKFYRLLYAKRVPESLAEALEEVAGHKWEECSEKVRQFMAFQSTQRVLARPEFRDYPPHFLEAIHAYMLDTVPIYEEIAKSLTFQGRGWEGYTSVALLGVLPMVKLLMAALQRLPQSYRLPPGTSLWRVLRNFKHVDVEVAYPVGTVIPFLAFKSGSRSEDGIKNFLVGASLEDCTIFLIRPHRAYMINEFSMYREEDECVCAPFELFQIESTTKGGNGEPDRVVLRGLEPSEEIFDTKFKGLTFLEAKGPSLYPPGQHDGGGRLIPSSPRGNNTKNKEGVGASSSSLAEMFAAASSLSSPPPPPLVYTSVLRNEATRPSSRACGARGGTAASGSNGSQLGVGGAEWARPRPPPPPGRAEGKTPEEQAEDDALKPDWESFKDASSGKFYYHHMPTGEVTWHRHQAAKPESRALPSSYDPQACTVTSTWRLALWRDGSSSFEHPSVAKAYADASWDPQDAAPKRGGGAPAPHPPQPKAHHLPAIDESGWSDAPQQQQLLLPPQPPQLLPSQQPPPAPRPPPPQLPQPPQPKTHHSVDQPAWSYDQAFPSYSSSDPQEAAPKRGGGAPPPHPPQPTAHRSADYSPWFDDQAFPSYSSSDPQEAAPKRGGGAPPPHPPQPKAHRSADRKAPGTLVSLFLVGPFELNYIFSNPEAEKRAVTLLKELRDFRRRTIDQDERRKVLKKAFLQVHPDHTGTEDPKIREDLRIWWEIWLENNKEWYITGVCSDSP